MSTVTSIYHTRAKDVPEEYRETCRLTMLIGALTRIEKIRPLTSDEEETRERLWRDLWADSGQLPPAAEDVGAARRAVSMCHEPARKERKRTLGLTQRIKNV